MSQIFDKNKTDDGSKNLQNINKPNLVDDFINLSKVQINNDGPIGDISYTTNPLIPLKSSSGQSSNCEICKNKCLEILELVNILNKKIENMDTLYSDNLSLLKKVSRLEKNIARNNITRKKHS